MTIKIVRIAALLAGVLLLAACAGPATRVVLLPQADGSASGVVVTTNAGSTELNKPYALAEVSKAGAIQVGQETPDLVAKRNPELLSMLPAPAQDFLLYFKPGGTDFTDESRAELDKVLAAAQRLAGGEILVTGHTDTVGTDDTNDKVSQRRAELIRQAIIDKGFPADRIEAVGRGKRQLLIKTGDQVDEPRNRRVEVNLR